MKRISLRTNENPAAYPPQLLSSQCINLTWRRVSSRYLLRLRSTMRLQLPTANPLNHVDIFDTGDLSKVDASHRSEVSSRVTKSVVVRTVVSIQLYYVSSIRSHIETVGTYCLDNSPRRPSFRNVRPTKLRIRAYIISTVTKVASIPVVEISVKIHGNCSTHGESTRNQSD